VRLLFLPVVLFCFALPAASQGIHFDGTQMDLEHAVERIQQQAGVNVVYAFRLVEGVHTTCAYRGAGVEEALACVLAGTGLRAERLRRRQFVLVESRDLPDSRAPERLPLAGFVVDDETGDGLPGAHVWLPDEGLGTTTNRAGYFALGSLPNTSFRVRISFVGFESIDTTLAAGLHSEPVRLRVQALTTGTVRVEADPYARRDLAPITGMLSAAAGELSSLPATLGERDLFQALHWMPGVRSSGEINGGLTIRGYEPDQNLYLLDGAPLYHPWHAFSLVSTLQSETLKHVRLYRGAVPAEHGGRLSGVLEAEMRDGQADGPSASAAMSPLSGRFLIESPIGPRSSFMVSGRRSYIDKLIGRQHPVMGVDGRLDTLRTGYFFFDTSAKYSFRHAPGRRFSVSYYRGGDELDLRLPFDLSLDLTSWLRPADLFFEIEQNWGNQLFSARYEALLRPEMFLTATAYRSAYEAFEGSFIQPSSASSLFSGYDVTLRDHGLRLDIDYYPRPTHQLRGGVQVARYDFASTLEALVERSPLNVDTLSEASRLDAYDVSVYMQDLWSVSNSFNLLAGVRAAYFSEGGYLSVSPRISAQYTMDPRWMIIRMSAGRQVQHLHRLRDRYSFMYDLVSSRWIPANRDVRPSESGQVSLGLESRPARGVRLSAEAYVSQARNVLLPEDEYRQKDGIEGPGIDVGTLLAQYVPGRSRTHGIELGVNVQRGPWRALVNYSGGRSLSRAPGLGEVRYRPARFDVPRGFQGAVSYEVSRWHIGTGLEARSGYPHTVPVARYALGDPLDEDPVLYLHRPAINNGRLPPYLRLDLTAGHRFHVQGSVWKVQVHLYNVLNRRNVTGRTYDPHGDVVIRTDRRGFPFLPLFELEMRL
jgi:hypothetical protein